MNFYCLRPVPALLILLGVQRIGAHDLSEHDVPGNRQSSVGHASVPARLPLKVADAVAQRLSLFNRFGPNVRATTNATQWIVESDGMPDHRMMVGITAWQQQVPLPQPYTATMPGGSRDFLCPRPNPSRRRITFSAGRSRWR